MNKNAKHKSGHGYLVAIEGPLSSEQYIGAGEKYHQVNHQQLSTFSLLLLSYKQINKYTNEKRVNWKQVFVFQKLEKKDQFVSLFTRYPIFFFQFSFAQFPHLYFKLVEKKTLIQYLLISWKPGCLPISGHYIITFYKKESSPYHESAILAMMRCFPQYSIIYIYIYFTVQFVG